MRRGQRPSECEGPPGDITSGHNSSTITTGVWVWREMQSLGSSRKFWHKNLGQAKAQTKCGKARFTNRQSLMEVFEGK